MVLDARPPGEVVFTVACPAIVQFYIKIQFEIDVVVLRLETKHDGYRFRIDFKSVYDIITFFRVIIKWLFNWVNNIIVDVWI